MPNRLVHEKSPYLLQHAENPVAWYPWGDEAFAAAREADKPIFLSVGYSTCHWCHVMAHESFESEAIAEVLNRDFVPVKVDREERPDVDRVYMTFVQATTGSGGWPMSVWLTPSLKPFFGGTYFPPETRWGRAGFVEVLQAIARAWRDDRPRVEQSADSLVSELQRAASGRTSTQSPAGVASPESLAAGVRQFELAYDARRGGFGDAPKFPRPSELLFLLREHARTGHAAARDMVLHTLRAMALGGMRDHIGGGFHRYSVDGDWRVPHFEKMLYDQAQLVLAYLEAAQVTGDPFFAQSADDTLQYVARELTSPSGGFYSAEDADSIPPEQAGRAGAHGVEGAFYVWAASELRDLLGDDYDAFALRFGVEDGGNAPSDPQGEFVGKNLLYTARSVADIAGTLGESEEAVIAALARARIVLFGARLTRPRPHLDDKVLTAWNGLMIAAFARASRVLRAETFGLQANAEHYRTIAARAAQFVYDELWDSSAATLYRRHRDGQRGVEGYAEDYASATFGLLELFQADGNVRWLAWADALQDVLDRRFWDDEGAGWFSTTGEDSSVLLRLKEDYDGAEPSAGAMALLNLLTLTHLRPDPARSTRVERGLARYGSSLGGLARAVPLVAAALSTWHAGVGQAVIVGRSGVADFEALQAALASHYVPFSIVVAVDPAVGGAKLVDHLPFIASMTAVKGAATAYVCRDFTCQAPATTVDGLLDALDEGRRRANDGRNALDLG
jgi:uncharacterized protein YyaL (SSP411 family)